jgi:A/G-specific adenine glycosylase
MAGPRQPPVAAGTAAPANLPALHAAVLDWYAANGRSLAFRDTTDPYAILVSELMAQQTQAARAADAWRAFLAAFPTLQHLAAATPAAVLRAWSGLGYNRRALALRRAAIIVVERHGGRLPDEVETLEQLPGIGPYTARAVAALAFGRPFGPVDTNVRRVLSRALLGVEPARPGDRPAVRPAALQQLADAAVPAGRAGAWTHALMDLGAAVCRPGLPRCGECPVQPWCRFQAGELEGGVGKAGRRSTRAAAIGVDAPRRRRVSEPRAPFEATTRWLRGRLLARLCAAPDGQWLDLGHPIGDHDADAVGAALEAMHREGLAELHPSSSGVARLPLA